MYKHYHYITSLLMPFSIAIMSNVLMAFDDVVSGKVVGIALELGREDVTVGVG